MGFYDGIKDAKAASDRSPMIRAGHYLGRVDRVRSSNSRKGHPYVAFDVTILHVYPDGDTPMMLPEGATPDATNWVEDPKGKHSIGDSATLMWNSQFESAAGNYKTCLANALGISTDDITEELCAQIEKENLLAGTVLDIPVQIVETKAKRPFTKPWITSEVPASEYQNILTEATAQRFFPEGFDALIAAESD